MDSFLYRGVSESMHANNTALLPKGNSFLDDVEMGSSIAELGIGITLECSEENAVIGHQMDSNEYKTSGISTTPHIERARFYATCNNSQTGFIYTIDINRLEDFHVNMKVVASIVNGPNIIENDEIILIHKDNGAIPREIVVEITRVSANE